MRFDFGYWKARCTYCDKRNKFRIIKEANEEVAVSVSGEYIIRGLPEDRESIRDGDAPITGTERDTCREKGSI